MDPLDFIGLPGLAYLLENTKLHSSSNADEILRYVSKLLADFLSLDRYEVYRRIEDTRTALYSGALPAEPPKYGAWKDVEELEAMRGESDEGKRIYSMMLAASFLGSFYTGRRGVPIKLFEPIGVDEARFIISLSLLLTRIVPVLGKDAYNVWLDFNDGLAIVSEPDVVGGKNTLLIEAMLGSRSVFVDTLIAETLYINKIVSSPSDTFLHGVLGLMSFSSSFRDASKLSSRLWGLSERDLLSFLSIIGFYIGIPGLKRKVRKLQYSGELFRGIPLTHDILRDALARYRSDGSAFYGSGGVSPESLIERSLRRRLTHSEAKALALAMVIDLRRKTLKRMIEEDSLRILIGDALSSMFKSLSHIYTSEQIPNVQTDLVVEDGLRRLPAGEDTPLYAFLRDQFDSFDVKYMDDVLFELPFRLRLLKKTFETEGEAKVNASTALSFIYSLGTPMRRRTGYRLLTFIADALQSGRLSSAELYYESGATRLRYMRSRKIASTKRILKTNFPMLPDMFAFSRMVRGALDRNSSEDVTERPASEAERLSSRILKEFVRLRKKHIGGHRGFVYLERIHPIVLFALPLAIVASYEGVPLADILQHIDFAGDSPSRAILYVRRGDAEDLFTKAKEALEAKPYEIDQEHIHTFKLAAANGFTILFRDEVGKKGLRPLRIHELIELAPVIKRTLTHEEALITLYQIASHFGYVRLYGEAETVVTLNYSAGAIGILNTHRLVDVAPTAAVRDGIFFDRTLIEQAKEDRVYVRDKHILQEYFGSFFRLMTEGLLPLIAKSREGLFIRVVPM